MKETYLIIRTTKTSGRSVRLGMRAHGAPVHLELHVDELDDKQLAQERNREDHVDMAEMMPLQLIRPTVCSDTIISAALTNWGIEAIGADQTDFSGEGITVAVLDTGIDASHPAFDRVDLNQKNFTEGSAVDEDGHGTHCAGTLFGRDVDSRRIGVARGVKRALIGKVIGETGGSTVALVQAIEWAVREGAYVISLSLGLDFPGYQANLVSQGLPLELATSRALRAYVNNIRVFDSLAALIENRAPFGQPAFLVAASGNESRTDKDPAFKLSASPPSASRGFISVGAIGPVPGQSFMRAPFSNIDVSLVAPGVDIISAKAGGGLTVMSGTSMAVPHVAGVLALMVESATRRKEPLNSELLKSQLIASARRERLVSSTPDEVGAGLVQSPKCPKAESSAT